MTESGQESHMRVQILCRTVQFDIARQVHIFETFAEACIDGMMGTGLAEFCYRVESPSLPTPISVNLLTSSDSNPLVLKLTDLRCCDTILAGGKGASLSYLSRYKVIDQNCKVSFSDEKSVFSVPAGFVITSKAYDMYLSDLRKTDLAVNVLLKSIEDEGRVQGRTVSWKCEAIKDAIMKGTLPSPLVKDIEESLAGIFMGGPETSLPLLAVRSSALGEDGAASSSAGQLEVSQALHHNYDKYLDALAVVRSKTGSNLFNFLFLLFFCIFFSFFFFDACRRTWLCAESFQCSIM